MLCCHSNAWGHLSLELGDVLPRFFIFYAGYIEVSIGFDFILGDTLSENVCKA